MSERQLNVFNLPEHAAAADLTGSTVIVIDLLRASTTICQALASGAKEVVPFLEVDEALAAAACCERSEIVLGGERFGRRITGFDLGNSPSEYTSAAVGRRRVFFTTTNGTRALNSARSGHRVLIGSLVNLSAVARAVKDERRVDIVCAGTNGVETREDILAAGAIVSKLVEQTTGEISGSPWKLGSAAESAKREWQTVIAAAPAAGRSISEQVALELRETPGGRNLMTIGLDRDLVDCAQVACLNVAPEVDRRAWRIYLP
jgi:2-phosphosulfolactate phosphatase